MPLVSQTSLSQAPSQDSTGEFLETELTGAISDTEAASSQGHDVFMVAAHRAEGKIQEALARANSIGDIDSPTHQNFLKKINACNERLATLKKQAAVVFDALSGSKKSSLASSFQKNPPTDSIETSSFQ